MAGDPRATIGNNFKISPDEDTIEVRLRNSTEDSVHHHWVIHNFHPTKIGDIDLSHDSSSFVEFEVTGTFTHIDYDCGHNDPPNPFAQSSSSSGGSDGQSETTGDASNGQQEEGFYPYADGGSEQGDEETDNSE